MITSIYLKNFTNQEKTSTIVITGAPVTIFVGPNNSGKSLLIRELTEYLLSGNKNANWKLLKDISIESDMANYAEYAQRFLVPPIHGESLNPDHGFFEINGNRGQYHIPNLEQAIQNPQLSFNVYSNIYLRHVVKVLNGPNRTNLINDVEFHDLQQSPGNTLTKLFLDDTKRKRVREIILDAFGKHFVLDPTRGGQLRIRLSDVRPPSDSVERSLDDQAIRFHSAAGHISSYSDGVKAFVGLICELVAGSTKYIFIDEAEAFLHPNLAHKFGRIIGQLASEEGKQVFVSTHSSDFLMGCIGSGVFLNIVRLTYESGFGYARLLEGKTIQLMVKNPLLRSTGILKGIFYENVVVTEGDNDRSFYQEINERINQVDGTGIKNALFVNAQNLHTIHIIAKPLFDLGIRVSIIPDLDALNETGVNWQRLCDSCGVPIITSNGISTSKAKVVEYYKNNNWKIKEMGINIPDAAIKMALLDIIDQLKKYRIFLVTVGELENWLKHLGVPGETTNWLIGVFEKMGSDPKDPGYIQPAKEDVWDFIRGMA